MITIVIGCPGIGKTFLSKKNELFVDSNGISAMETIRINKIKKNLINIDEINNKIFMQNIADTRINNIKNEKCIVIFINYLNALDSLLKRIYIREKNRSKTAYFTFSIKNLKKKLIEHYNINSNIIKNINKKVYKININNNNINNLEKILICIYNKENKID